MSVPLSPVVAMLYVVSIYWFYLITGSPIIARVLFTHLLSLVVKVNRSGLNNWLVCLASWYTSNFNLCILLKVNQGWVRSSFWLLGNYVYLLWTLGLSRDPDNLDRERWHSGHFWSAVWKTDNCVIVSNYCHPDNEPYLTYLIDPIIFHGTNY